MSSDGVVSCPEVLVGLGPGDVDVEELFVRSSWKVPKSKCCTISASTAEDLGTSVPYA